MNLCVLEHHVETKLAEARAATARAAIVSSLRAERERPLSRLLSAFAIARRAPVAAQEVGLPTPTGS